MKADIKEYVMEVEFNTHMLKDRLRELETLIVNRLKPELGQTAMCIASDIEGILQDAMTSMWLLESRTHNVLCDLDDV